MMKLIIKVSILSLFLFTSICFGVEKKAIGNITFSMPKGWIVHTEEVVNGLPSISIRGSEDALAITVISMDATSIQTQEQLDQFLRMGVKPMEEGSVEGKTTVRHLTSSNLICSYANHTDKALISKPVQPDNWKYTTTGFVKIDSSLLFFTYFTNNQGRWKKGVGLQIIKTLEAMPNNTPASKAFDYEIKEHKVHVSIPGIPQIKLTDHPQKKSYPHLRYMGSADSYNLSILSPTIDKGMTSLEFADSRIKQLTKQYGLSDKQYRPYRQSGSDCFSMFYFIKTDEFIQLHGHLFAVSPQGTHGIEVHISKITQDKNEVPVWMKGLPEAKIK